MKFNEFLDTLLPTYNVLPSQKLKDDLATFKSAFNYANKTDDIYNDLIDNIVKLLRIKFGEYEIIYSSPLVMYNELLITLNPQLPQFLMIQKKQLIETLNTFGDLQNWGDVLKDNVRKALNLSDTNSNATSYVPFDGVDKDPYSVNDVNGQREVNETTDYNRLATDYLNFYKKIRWNIASIELNKIYQDYIKLFKIYYNYNGFSNQYNSEWAAQIRDNTDNIAILAEEIDKTNYNVGVNTSNIVANSNRIDMTNNNLTTNYYDKTTADSTFGSLAQQTTNTQDIADLTNRVGTNETNITTLTGNVSTNTNRINQISTSLENGNIMNYVGVWNSGITYDLAQVCTLNDLWYVSNQDNNLNHQPTGASDAYWKVISSPSVNLNDYYTKQESDGKFATITITNGLNTRLTTAEQTLSTNSTNIVNLNNTKADKADVYTKTYIDGNFYNKTYLDLRLMRKRDVTITKVDYWVEIITDSLWKANVMTNLVLPSYDYYLNKVCFTDISFPNAKYTNWKWKITGTYTNQSGSNLYIGFSFLYTQDETVKPSVGEIVRIFYTEEIRNQ